MIVSARATRSGFTLIELSIVLVIIGLIVGGVLVGRDLIKTAEIRAQIKQLADISQAFNTFRGKYNQLPGDIRRDAQRFGLTVGNPTGPFDDGVIQDSAGNSPVHGGSYEPMNFFGHLTEARLLTPSYVSGTSSTGSPCINYTGEAAPQFYKMKLNNGMGMIAQTYQGNVWLYLGISDCSQIVSNYFDATGTLTPWQANAIDTKIDNGVPSTGSIIALMPDTNYGLLDTLDVTAGSCVTTASATAYNISNTGFRCRLLTKLP